MMTMSSADTGYRSTERRKRTKSESAASVGATGAGSYMQEQNQGSSFANRGFMRYVIGNGLCLSALGQIHCLRFSIDFVVVFPTLTFLGKDSHQDYL